MTSQQSKSSDQKKRPVRRFRRRTVRIQVEYESPENELIREYATTLGAGGLFIQSDRPLPKGNCLRLAFTLPGQARKHEIQGRVVWTSHDPQPGELSGPVGMGVQFTDRVGEAMLARELENWQPDPQ